jgi:hypothetical protein
MKRNGCFNLMTISAPFSAHPDPAVHSQYEPSEALAQD